jgi:hypothetical protein
MDVDPMAPPAAPPMAPGRVLARKEQVMSAFIDAKRPSRRRRRRLFLLAAFAALFVGATGTTAYALLKPAPVTVLGAGVGCFEKASLRADVAVVSLKGLDPVSRCREVWASGGFGEGRKVPHLVACVYPTSGAVAVVPGRDESVCDRNGFRRPEPGQIDKVVLFDRLRQAIEERLHAVPGGCADAAAATAAVDAELRVRNLTGWRVEFAYRQVPAFPGDRDPGCAGLDYIDGDRQVVQVSVARR